MQQTNLQILAYLLNDLELTGVDSHTTEIINSLSPINQIALSNFHYTFLYDKRRHLIDLYLDSLKSWFAIAIEEKDPLTLQPIIHLNKLKVYEVTFKEGYYGN